MKYYKVVDGFTYHLYPIGTIVSVDVECEQDAEKGEGKSCMFTDGNWTQILLWDHVEDYSE